MEKIVNRHIARLLDHLAPLNIPTIGQDSIKRYMWFLARDIEDYNKERQGTSNDNHSEN